MTDLPRPGCAPEPPFFHACLQPAEGMSTRCFIAMAATIILLAVGFACILLAHGHVLAVPFLAAEVALLLGMIELCRRRRAWTEEVRADRGGISIDRFDHAGRHRDGVTLPLLNLTLERVEDPDYGLRQLLLRSRGRAIELARDLAPSERASFAEAFEQALRLAHCPPRRRHIALPALLREA